MGGDGAEAVTVRELHGIHRGETVVVVAPGPSLASESFAEWRNVGPVVLVSWAFRWPPGGAERAQYWLTVDGPVTKAGSGAATYERAVILANRAPDYTGKAPAVHFNLGAIDRETVLKPGMATREAIETGSFPGQSLARNQDRGPDRLLCPGSTLVCAVHLALVLTAGEGRICLLGADGRIVSNRRRFIDGEVTDKPNPRQLEKANRVLASSRESLVAGLPGLEMVNATPGSAIGWPRWRPETAPRRGRAASPA